MRTRQTRAFNAGVGPPLLWLDTVELYAARENEWNGKCGLTCVLATS